MDGQPFYVKDTNRLYIGNNRLSTDGQAISLVAPYKHTIRFQFKGGSNGNGSIGSWAILPYINIDTTITCSSFRKDPITIEPFQSGVGGFGSDSTFSTAWNSLWLETDLTKKLFPVSITGFAHSAYATRSSFASSSDPWSAQGIAGPIVGYNITSNSDSTFDVLFSYLFQYSGNDQNLDNYTYALGYPIKITSSSGPDSRHYYIDGKLEIPVPVSSLITVHTSWSTGGGMLRPESGSFSDTVTENY